MIGILLSLLMLIPVPGQAGPEQVGPLFQALSKKSEWKLVQKTRLLFNSYHPQGVVRIGDRFYLSSVEVIEQPELFASPQGGYDRTAGKGVGHLFEFDLEGKLIRQTEIGRETIYHPGGIDYDGRSIWVPVAEYRPQGQSILYRVNPKTLEAAEVFHVADHIGAIAHAAREPLLYGVNWGSREFYVWKSNGSLVKRTTNGNHYIDYQDCHAIGGQQMLCGGLNQYQPQKVGNFSLGGIDLIDLTKLQAIHQLPITLYSDKKNVMTRNPMAFEVVQDHLRCYFIPDDETSTLYIFDVSPP